MKKEMSKQVKGGDKDKVREDKIEKGRTVRRMKMCVCGGGGGKKFQRGPFTVVPQKKNNFLCPR